MLALVAPAQADFGIHDFDLTYANADGTSATQAGSHPFAVNTGPSPSTSTAKGPPKAGFETSPSGRSPA